VRKAGWATVAFMLCSLTACNGEASSTAGPDPTPSPSVTGSPSDPSPSHSPDTQTPEEFVRAWVAEYNAMQNSGDTEKFRSMSRRCEPCSAVADRMDRYYEAGGYVKTEGFIIKSLRVSKPNGKGQRAVTINVDASPVEYVEEEGGAVQTLPGGSPTYEVDVEPRGRTWNVFEIFQKARLPQ
jgi:hypothetical protein